jgi:hypothetical protein
MRRHAFFAHAIMHVWVFMKIHARANRFVIEPEEK